MLKNKIFGIPLIFLLMACIAGATIIAPVIYTVVNMTGTYTDSGYPGVPHYEVSDGDPTDQVTFTKVGNDVTVSFPAWKSANDIEYQKMLAITPDMNGSLIIRDIKYTGNGVTVLKAEINPVGYMGQYSYSIPPSPQTNSFGIGDAKAGTPYYFSMKMSTNSSANVGENLGIS